MDLGPKMPHQEKVPLTCRRGEEAHGSGDILDRMAGLLIHERRQGSGAGCKLVPVGAEAERYTPSGVPWPLWTGA